jgi:hypothetical protein
MPDTLSLTWVLVLGGAGALLPDLLRIIKLRADPVTPAYLRWPRYWLSLLGLVGIGVLAAWLGRPASVAQALALSFAAPEFLTKLFAGSLPVASERNGGRLRLRLWWAR